MTNTQAILLNAFDLLANKRTRRFISELKNTKGKLHEFIEFDGPLILDSGAFNFLKLDEINITPNDVLSVGIELGADMSVVLDHPFLPKSEQNEKGLRWSNTMINTRRMLEGLSRIDSSILPDGYKLIPVLHGHDSQTLSRAYDDIVKIWEGEPDIVGIGSLAPLALNGNKRTVVDVILTARNLLPNAHIHCFSLGSALLMLFAFFCGANSVDSQSWIISAAFKQVQLPGLHLTRISRMEAEKNSPKYNKARKEFAQHLVKLIYEENFIAKDWDAGDSWPIGCEKDAFHYLDYLEDGNGKNQIHRRACHNLYGFNFEAGRVRQEMGSGTLDSFIQNRMSGTVYQKVLEYAIEKKMRAFY